MTSAIAPDSLRLVQEVAPVLRHRKVVLFGRFAPAWRPEVEALRAMGARPPLVVTARGTGDPLPAGAAEVFHTELTAPDAVAGFRTWEALAANPPPAVRAAVERFDPAGEAIAILDASASRERLLGRLVFGARPPAWVRWEDKLEVDRIWDACGVPRPPSAVVPLADASALSHYSNRLDAGDGVVWAGDASQGFNAGAALTRPVFSGVDVAGARAFFEGRCAAVRITPFLRGIPCRVHGFVLPSGVCGGSPVELLTLATEHGTFRSAGYSTIWRPSRSHEEEVRGVARRVGGYLAARGLRGAYCVDGILTGAGFRPTELNPRLGPGLDLMDERLGDLGLGLLTAVPACPDRSGVIYRRHG